MKDITKALVVVQTTDSTPTVGRVLVDADVEDRFKVTAPNGVTHYKVFATRDIEGEPKRTVVLLPGRFTMYTVEVFGRNETVSEFIVAS